jgi:hypothetical protein
MPGWVSILTPLGMTMGFLPMRDMLISFQFPVASSSCQFLVASFQLPVSSCQLPVATC